MNANDDPKAVSKKFPFVAARLAVLAAVGLAGGRAFIHPYDVPEFQEIDTSDSAFLIPLEGDTTKQQMFPSVDFLNEQKVAAKRVQIPHRWQPTGFLPRDGQYVATVRLVKVDRKPVTREWTRNSHTGTSTKDEAVQAESKDSINFSMGVTCTANIPEEMAATFLYTYPSKSLADILDSEIRARVQQVLAEEAAGHPFGELLGKKVEMIAAVRTDVVPFFEKRGIKITTIGMLGGIQFENPEIQKVIDDSIKAQQLKTVAEAKREAQEVENKRLKMEATALTEVEALKAESAAKLKKQLALAESEAEAIKAESQAKSRLRIAETDAEALKKLAEARVYEAEKAAESGVGDVLVKLRQIELESARWKQWDGKIPAMPWWPGMSQASVLFPLGETAKK